MEGELSVFHFPFQPIPRVSVGMELESNFFQKDSNWKILEDNYGTDNKRK